MAHAFVVEQSSFFRVRLKRLVLCFHKGCNIAREREREGLSPNRDAKEIGETSLEGSADDELSARGKA